MGDSLFDFGSFYNNSSDPFRHDNGMYKLPMGNLSLGNTTISLPQDTVRVYKAREVAFDLLMYFMPVIIFAGTLGNVLSFTVLLRKRMRYTSIYFYLLFLACADTMVLYVSAFKTWIRLLTGFEMLHLNSFSCKTTMFLLLVSLHMSAWLIVVVTLDRWVLVICHT